MQTYIYKDIQSHPLRSAVRGQQLDCWCDLLGPIAENVLVSAKLKNNS